MGESFRPCIGVRTRSTGETVEIRFRDNGVGIPGSVIHQVFLPFFTTKGDNKHIGLGLSIAYDIIVQEHGGQIEAQSSEGDWAEVVIRLPMT